MCGQKPQLGKTMFKTIIKITSNQDEDNKNIGHQNSRGSIF